jgi:speckle-type POZ protein
VLAKHSDVFDAMFSHNFAEAKSGRVDIKDLDPDAVAEMLRYIYTSQVQGMEILNRCLIMLQFSNASALALSLDAA